jgi:hypothetical protein
MGADINVSASVIPGYTSVNTTVTVLESVLNQPDQGVVFQVKMYSVSGSIINGPIDCTGITVNVTGSNIQ